MNNGDRITTRRTRQCVGYMSLRVIWADGNQLLRKEEKSCWSTAGSDIGTKSPEENVVSTMTSEGVDNSEFWGWAKPMLCCTLSGKECSFCVLWIGVPPWVPSFLHRCIATRSSCAKCLTSWSNFLALIPAALFPFITHSLLSNIHNVYVPNVHHQIIVRGQWRACVWIGTCGWKVRHLQLVSK